jgi:hypothetical protein
VFQGKHDGVILLTIFLFKRTSKKHHNLSDKPFQTLDKTEHMKTSYLKPNRNSLQKPMGGRSVLTVFHAKQTWKNHVEPIYRGE